MKQPAKLLLLAMVPICFFASCKHEPAGTIVPTPVSGGTQTCSTDTVYFQNNVLPLIVSSCAKSGCHDAISKQDGIELTSYDKIMASGTVNPGNPGSSELYEVLNETRPDKIMPQPPSSPLTSAEKSIIYKWIQQGAKNNACNDCDTSSFTYSGALLPIINIHCKGCHNPGFISGGLDLTTYANVRSIALNGKLMGSVDHLPGFPAMPKGGTKLNDCKLTQIRKWITAGSLNN